MKEKFATRWKKLASALLILIMGSLLLNQALYTHSHVRPDGSIVSHAHPFNKSQESKQGAAHQHSTLEFYLIDQLDILIFSISAVFFIKSFNIASTFRIRTENRQCLQMVSFSPGRAPPSCM